MIRALLILLLLARSTHAAFFNNYDHEARNWNFRTGTNTAGGLSYVAATRWMLQTRSAGLRRGILRANLFAGTALTNAMSPIVRDFGTTADLTVGSSSPTYSLATGLTAVDNNSVVKTGVEPNAAFTSTNSAGFMVYMGGTTGAETCSQGAANFGSSGLESFLITTAHTGIGQTTYIWRDTGHPPVAGTNGTGFFMSSRTGSATNSVAVYWNGNRTGESTSVGGTTFTTGGPGLLILGLNLGGGVFDRTTHPGRGYMFTQGWSNAQVANSYRIWQRFQSTLGRAVAP